MDDAERRPLPSTAQLEATRNRVIQALGAHFAEDHLSLEELESRIERALKAPTSDTLEALLDGLPALPGAGAGSVGVPAPAQGRSIARSVHAERKTILAFMGGVVRRGVWTVPSHIHAVALMGGVELDLREATLAPGVTEIRAVAIMGAVIVRVPPHVRVESDGIAILGGFEDQLEQPASSDPHSPVVRLTGFSIMGGVEAKVEPPGPGGADAISVRSDAT